MRRSVSVSVSVALALAAVTAAPAAADDQRDAAQGIGELTRAMRAHDARAIAKQMRAPVTSSGVWFPDAACTSKFGKPGTILTQELAPFARCLAQLRPQLSTRKSGQRDGAVLTYDPGIELHVAFAGPLVRAIGFEAQTSADASVPTLTVQAFEALRAAGTTLLDDALAPTLRATAAKQGSVFAWMKVCIDARGAITNAWTVQSTTTAVGEAFRLAIADWRFRPLVIAKVATPACALSLLTYPAAKAPAVETLPPFDVPRSYDIDDRVAADLWTDDLDLVAPVAQVRNVSPSTLEALRKTGSPAIHAKPAQLQALRAAGKTKVTSAFKVCIDVRGAVSAISVLRPSGVASYDALVTGAIRQWTYRPYRVNGAATPACTALTFVTDAGPP